MASKTHRPPPGSAAEPSAKRTRQDEAAEPLVARKMACPLRVELNPADCDLDFDISGDGLRGQALYEGGFAYCWSGARATIGIRGGKYCFGCKIVTEQVVDMADTPPDQQHVCRVGISRGDDLVANLGESEHSFGFGGTGKFSNAGKFSDYGTKFGVGDTIVCAVNLDSKPLASIAFSKNGQRLGIARRFDASSKFMGLSPLRELPWESAVFPHVLLKNVVVRLQFCLEDGLIPEEGYKPWNAAIADGNAIFGPVFSDQRECEVIMMVGLPASGKTTWAEKWEKQRREKRYVLLGTNLALDQMKVPGLLRKHNYGERFQLLMDRATGIFNTLLARAAKIPRNYIIDQTNVYRSARNRKLKAFANYHKIAVVIFPSPNELKLRAEKRFKEMGKEVPVEAVNEMIANYILPITKNMPGSSEYFDEVIFPELFREEAQRHLDEMKRMLRSHSTSAKNDLSPYSRENSGQSNAIASGVDYLMGSQPRVRVPYQDNLNNQYIDSTFSGIGSPVSSWTTSGVSGVNVPMASPRESYSNYGRTPLLRAEEGPYRASVVPTFYSRSTYERDSAPLGDMSHYQTYDSAATFRRPSFLSPNSTSSYQYPSTPPSFSSQPCEPRAPGFHNIAHQEPRSDWHSPIQNVHGSSYANMPPRPPYGAPRSLMDPRPRSQYH